jgi:5-methylcytosine-specific restriction enzyme subunit McrC
VLDNQSTEPGPGGITIASFVVNMATVFEDFVSTALREALAPYSGETRCQYQTHLGVGAILPIRPDVVYIVGDLPVAVFDAKYKVEAATSGYPNSDTYQMLAYCTALNLPHGWLVYAEGKTPASTLQVSNTDIHIAYRPLDLSADPVDLLGQISALAADAMAHSLKPLRSGGLRTGPPSSQAGMPLGNACLGPRMKPPPEP